MCIWSKHTQKSSARVEYVTSSIPPPPAPAPAPTPAPAPAPAPTPQINGYVPALYETPPNCCEHTAAWDDPFTLMCQTCAYDIFAMGNRDITYKYYENNIVNYEVTCQPTSFHK